MSVSEIGGSLPRSWCLVGFEDALKIASDEGKRIPQSDYLEGGALPVIDQGEAFIGGYTNKLDAQYAGPLPLIVFGDHTRRVKYVEQRFAVGAQGVKLLVPTGAFAARYLAYLVPVLPLPDRGYSRHFQFLRNMQFPMPPRAEQDRIVAEIEKQFTRLDAAVAALKRVQANLKRYRAAVLKAACEGRLVPTEAELARKEGRSYETGEQLLARILKERRAKWETDQLAKMHAAGKPPKDDDWKRKYKQPVDPDKTDTPCIPDGWAIASMDQLTTRITSGSRDWSSYYTREDGSIFIMAQNVRPGRLDLSFRQYVRPPVDDPSKSRSQIEPDDLLVTIVGANTGDVCRVTELLPEHYVCQSVALMRPVFPPVSGFLNTYMNSDENGQRQYRRYIYGAGRPHLDFEQLKMTPILLPPLSEQSRIGDEIERRLSTLAEVESEIQANLTRANRLRQSILKRAFEGKLVPQDPNDEPASVLLERIRAERAANKPKTRIVAGKKAKTIATA